MPDERAFWMKHPWIGLVIPFTFTLFLKTSVKPSGNAIHCWRKYDFCTWRSNRSTAVFHPNVIDQSVVFYLKCNPVYQMLKWFCISSVIGRIIWIYANICRKHWQNHNFQNFKKVMPFVPMMINWKFKCAQHGQGICVLVFISYHVMESVPHWHIL